MSVNASVLNDVVVVSLCQFDLCVVCLISWASVAFISQAVARSMAASSALQKVAQAVVGGKLSGKTSCTVLTVIDIIVLYNAVLFL